MTQTPYSFRRFLAHFELNLRAELQSCSSKIAVYTNQECMINKTGLSSAEIKTAYTTLFSNENGAKSCRFRLPFTLRCFRN